LDCVRKRNEIVSMISLFIMIFDSENSYNKL